jgi:penicillin-binding protein 2
VYNLLLTREKSPRRPEETARMLAPGINATEAEMLEAMEAGSSERAHKPIRIAEGLSSAEVAFVLARQYEMPEITIDFRPQRRYENDQVAAHVLGYVGEITAGQLAGDEFGSRRTGDIVGQTGLERQYDRILQGTDGIRSLIVNTTGREMGLIGEVLPVAGQDLVTTIDLDIQKASEAALAGRTGVAVVLDPRSGEVLAMASEPAFSPAAFSRGMNTAEWDALVTDPRRPLQNRAIQNQYAPGSIFKIFMTAAGLEEHIVDLNESVLCHGHTTLYGNTFNCWNTSGHGSLTIREALIHSCNVFFYLVGDKLGIDRIADHAMAMGLGRPTGIDLPGEVPGLIPTREWKRNRMSAPWYPGDTISVSIGQGAVNLTPLQLTWAVGGVAVGGNLVRPHIVHPGIVERAGAAAGRNVDVPDPLASEAYPLGPETVEAVREALWGVVNGGGTGGRAKVVGFDVAGKTGTAQVVSSGAAGNNPALQPHGWFVGFAPFDDPEIAIGVFVENGGSSSAAVPVAQQILQAYFDKATGITLDEDFLEQMTEEAALAGE